VWQGIFVHSHILLGAHKEYPSEGIMECNVNEGPIGIF